MTRDLRYDDAALAELLRACRVIAMVGASPSPARDSYRVMAYLKRHGYRILPVNPTVAQGAIQGEPVYASLADIPEPFQMVDVFRRSSAVAGIVDDILALPGAPPVRALWLQLGVIDHAAAERAAAAGIDVVMDRCLKIEHGRLL